MSAFSLNGKTALVTGANTGIGRAIALELGAAGAHVICAGRSDCTETAAQIGSAESLKLDFADPMAAQNLFAKRPIDILVNNAGIIARNDAVDFSEDDWNAVIDINLKALFFTCQAFARSAMKREAGGKIVNIASLLSFQGGIRVPSYTASKHGVAGLTKALANEWAVKHINVNAIAPGYIATNNTQALRDDPDRNAAILERIPAGRWGDPKDIAGTAVFLSAPASDYVHGAVLNVDGGWLARQAHLPQYKGIKRVGRPLPDVFLHPYATAKLLPKADIRYDAISAYGLRYIAVAGYQSVSGVDSHGPNSITEALPKQPLKKPS